MAGKGRSSSRNKTEKRFEPADNLEPSGVAVPLLHCVLLRELRLRDEQLGKSEIKSL